MKKLNSLMSLIVVAMLIEGAIGQTRGLNDYPKLAPFSAVRWDGWTPRVQVESRWYALISLNDIPAGEIVTFCRSQYGDRAKKRFGEDLVMVLDAMGSPPGDRVTLVLRDLDTQETVSKTEVEMTSENRHRVRDYNNSVFVPVPQIKEDLIALRSGLETRFAYLRTNGVDYRGAIDQVSEGFSSPLSTPELAMEVLKIVALFIDGHAEVSDVQYDRGYLPFLIEPSGDRFVAFFPDRSTFLDRDCPYLTHLDGLPIEHWLAATGSFIPQGSTQYRIRHGLRHLRYIQHYRRLLGIVAEDSIEARLTDRSGTSIQTKALSVSEHFPTYGTWPAPGSTVKMLNDNIGYLRIPAMDEGAATSISRWMDAMRATEGLIIDVRGNGGGSREVLLKLFSYLMQADDLPHMANVAAYRLFRGFGGDPLESRFLYRAGSPHWSPAERAAIKRYAPAFEPQWTPTQGEFSEWHYLVLSPKRDPEIYHYARPVVVLMDQKCFSATDIFLGAFKGWRNVTLMGTASAGGSARKQSFRLPHSGIFVTVASMASFQPNGRLYDTQGISPDQTVEPEPEYFLHGGRDTVLERAIQWIAKEIK